MAHSKAADCSPYLKQQRRSLPEACRDIARKQGDATPSCRACALAGLCAVSSSERRRLPEAQPRNPAPQGVAGALPPNDQRRYWRRRIGTIRQRRVVRVA